MYMCVCTSAMHVCMSMCKCMCVYLFIYNGTLSIGILTHMSVILFSRKACRD